MSQTKKMTLAGILIAIAALLLACLLGEFWQGAALALLVGLLGGFGAVYSWDWANTIFLIGTVFLVTLGGLVSLSPFLLLIALLGAVAAWDLTRLMLRQQEFPSNEALIAMERRHLRVLLLALVGGGILSGVALILRVQLGFGVALALGLTLVVSLAQVLRLLRR